EQGVEELRERELAVSFSIHGVEDCGGHGAPDVVDREIALLPLVALEEHVHHPLLELRAVEPSIAVQVVIVKLLLPVRSRRHLGLYQATPKSTGQDSGQTQTAKWHAHAVTPFAGRSADDLPGSVGLPAGSPSCLLLLSLDLHGRLVVPAVSARGLDRLRRGHGTRMPAVRVLPGPALARRGGLECPLSSLALQSLVPIVQQVAHETADEETPITLAAIAAGFALAAAAIRPPTVAPPAAPMVVFGLLLTVSHPVIRTT